MFTTATLAPNPNQQSLLLVDYWIQSYTDTVCTVCLFTNVTLHLVFYSCSDDDTENVPGSGTTSNDSVVATFLLHSLEGVQTEGYVLYM